MCSTLMPAQIVKKTAENVFMVKAAVSQLVIKGSLAHTGKPFCDKLFAIETDLEEFSPEERQHQRQEQSNPVLDALWSWLRGLRVGKNSLGMTVKYTLDQ